MAAASKFLEMTPEAFEAFFIEKTGIRKSAGEAALDSENFRFGEFREALKDKPPTLVRLVYGALKSGKKDSAIVEAHTESPDQDVRTAELRNLGFKTKLREADPAVLLRLYLPDKPGDPVTQALKERFGAQPIIAFREDGTVAVAESVQYVSDLEQGYPEQETLTVDGQLAKLCAIGTKPDTMVDEDPLFPNQPLRNGRSLVNHRNWTGIPLEKRQMCRIIVQRGDIDSNNRDAVLRLLERAQPKGGLSEAYPEAMLEFRELQKRDELPKLKMLLGFNANKPNNPFGVSRRY